MIRAKSQSTYQQWEHCRWLQMDKHMMVIQRNFFLEPCVFSAYTWHHPGTAQGWMCLNTKLRAKIEPTGHAVVSDSVSHCQAVQRAGDTHSHHLRPPPRWRQPGQNAEQVEPPLCECLLLPFGYVKMPPRLEYWIGWTVGWPKMRPGGSERDISILNV